MVFFLIILSACDCFSKKTLRGFLSNFMKFPCIFIKRENNISISRRWSNLLSVWGCEDRYSRDSDIQQTKCVNIGVYASGTMTYFSLFCFQYFFLVCYCLLTITIYIQQNRHLLTFAFISENIQPNFWGQCKLEGIMWVSVIKMKDKFQNCAILRKNIVACIPQSLYYLPLQLIPSYFSTKSCYCRKTGCNSMC